MVCQNCGKEIDNDSTFCSFCAYAIGGDVIGTEIKNTMIELYSPCNESELVLIKSILDAEHINYFVKNDKFGSMMPGPTMSFLNEKMIVVQGDQYEKAKALLSGYLNIKENKAETFNVQLLNIYKPIVFKIFKILGNTFFSAALLILFIFLIIALFVKPFVDKRYNNPKNLSFMGMLYQTIKTK